ncbi:MAG TPA: hypothetical protein VMV01_04825, partial [Planctomycetota bacterium]|nr:hypothetical protein [Planctomycetota bacterium]
MSGARRAAFLFARAGFAVFFFVSSLYGLFAYNPFTYQQIIRFELVPGLIKFAALQPWLYWPAQALAVLTLAGELRARRRPAVVYTVAATVAGLALTLHPVLIHLENDGWGLFWGLVFLVPIVALAVVDHLAVRGRALAIGFDLQHSRRIYWAALGAGLYVFAIYSIIYALRAGPDAADLDPWGQVVVSLTSMALHLVLFMGGFLAFILLRGLAGLAERPARAELIVSGLFLWFLMALFLESRVLAALSMNGTSALVVAGALAAAAAASLSGLAVRVARPDGSGPGGVALLLGPLALAPNARSPWAQAVGLTVLAALAGGLVAGTGTLDWNGLLAQLSALLVWAIAFATLLGRPPAGRA